MTALSLSDTNMCTHNNDQTTFSIQLLLYWTIHDKFTFFSFPVCRTTKCNIVRATKQW